MPYRDSKLTRILQESLGGNCKTTVIIACSPAHTEVPETISTCRFGQRAKLIQSKATKNVQKADQDMKKEMEAMRAEMEALRNENRTLKEEVQPAAAVAAVTEDQDELDRRQAVHAAAVAEMDKLKTELEVANKTVFTMEEQLVGAQQAADQKVQKTLRSLQLAEMELKNSRDTAERTETDMMEAQAQVRSLRSLHLQLIRRRFPFRTVVLRLVAIVQHHAKAVGMFEDRLRGLRTTYSEKLQVRPPHPAGAAACLPAACAACLLLR